MLPEFPNFTEVRFEYKPVFEEIFNKIQLEISDFSFAYIFGWREVFDTRISGFKGSILTLMKSPKNENNFFIAPIGANDAVEPIGVCIEYLKSRFGGGNIYSIPEKMYGHLKDGFVGLKFYTDRDYFDYLYIRKDSVELKGSKYDGKRNFIKRFNKNYEHGFKVITEENVSGCIGFLSIWCDMKNCRSIFGMSNEVSAAEEMLKNFRRLGMFGGLLRIERKVEALTLASTLNKKTAQIHLEKANPVFVGIYQAINQIFAEKILRDFEFINREQDMGEAGLRKAKLSYHP